MPWPMSTPEEMAVSSDSPKVHSWLFEQTRTPREILRFIRDSPKESHETHLAIHALAVRISEEQAKSAEKVERQTNKLIWLTWGIFGLTFALLLLTIYLCYHEQRSSKHAQFDNQRTTQK
jgi:hypothetical protein